MRYSYKLKSLEEIFTWTYRKFKCILESSLKNDLVKKIRVSMDMCHRVPNININYCCGDNISHDYMKY